MTFDQINYVIEINRTGSFSRAADNMFISQSALSLAIQSLEREIGQPLFSRTSRGVFPTAFGKTFVRYITPIQTQLLQIDSIFFAGKKKDSISFILANDGFAVASEVFAKLFLKYQLANVYMKALENYSNESKNLVSTGQADIGFVRIWTCYKKIEQQQMNAMGLIYQNVATLGIAIGIGPNNPLYNKNLDRITPEMLRDYPLIQHEYMDGGPYEDILTRVGIPMPPSRVVTSSRAVITDLLEQSNAYFISADTTRLYSNSDNIPRMIPLVCNDVHAELGWIARRGEALNPIALEYTNLLEQRFI